MVAKIANTLLAAAVMISAFAFAPVTASAHDQYFRDAPSRECSDEKMLNRITKRFRVQAKKVLHHPELEIIDISGVHQHRYEPQDVHLDRPIARRYCHGTAQFNDGAHRKIWFLIEGGAGFASYSDNVEFCISGFDRWNVYDAYCRVLR